MSESEAYFQQIMETGLISIRPVHETDGLFMVQSDAILYRILFGGTVLALFIALTQMDKYLNLPIISPYFALLLILGCLAALFLRFAEGVSYVFFLDRVELRLQGVTYLKKREKRRRDGVEHLFGEKPQKKERRQLRFRTLPRERLAGVKGPQGEMILLEKRRHSESASPLWLQKLCRPFGTMLLFVPKKEAKKVHGLLWGYVSGANPRFEDVD